MVTRRLFMALCGILAISVVTGCNRSQESTETNKPAATQSAPAGGSTAMPTQPPAEQKPQQ